MIKRLLAVLFLIPLLLTSCNFPASSPQRDEQPVYLPLAGVTRTPLISPTPDPAALIKLGDEVVLPEGSLAFSPLASADASGSPFTLNLGNDKAVMNNAAQTLFFSLASEPAGANADAAACLNRLLTHMQADLPGLSSSPSAAITAGGLSGLQTELTGTLLSAPMAGNWLFFRLKTAASACLALLWIARRPSGKKPVSMLFWRCSAACGCCRLAPPPPAWSHPTLNMDSHPKSPFAWAM